MRLIIQGELPDLNKYINAERSNKYGAASIKKKATESVAWACYEQKIPRGIGEVYLLFKWYCKNKRKDKDNVAFAKKFILDGLQLAEVINNDGWNDVSGFEDRFWVDKDNPRVEIEIEEVEG